MRLLRRPQRRVSLSEAGQLTTGPRPFLYPKGVLIVKKLQQLTWRLPLLAAMAALLVAVLPTVALAHETRTVAGKYKFVVGFLNEPALVDQPNGIDLTVTDVSTGQPVLGVEKSLKAQFVFGGESEDVTLSPRFNLPGKYTAYVIPTKTGTWKFHFPGKINRDNIDELFTSGPGRFDDVSSAQPVQFPAKETPLLDLSTQASSAQSAASAAQSSARLALMVGAAGLAAGIIGIVVAAVAVAKTRQGEPAGAASSERRVA